VGGLPAVWANDGVRMVLKRNRKAVVFLKKKVFMSVGFCVKGIFQ
jgi:hypothetical protein